MKPCRARSTAGFFRQMPLARLAVILWLAAAGCIPVPCRAAARADLYQATAPLADRSEAAQTAAFQAALRIVLVRLTGNRNADQDPALAPIVAEARRFVQQYRAAADDSVWVAFDGAAVERWLAQNGQPVWGRERPSTFVWLAVAQTGTVVTRDDTSELKMALDDTATARGIVLVWPTLADLQNNHLDYAAVMASGPAALAQIGRRLGGDGTLIGHAAGATLAAGVRWTQVFQDRSSEFSGALDGVNRAADMYAEIFAASGAPVPVDIEVSGVNDVHQYSTVENYLESRTFISQLSVQALSGETVRFRLTSRGGPDALRRALALNGPLEPLAVTDGGLQRFRLRQ
jgi:hypothetical protein